MARIFYGSTSAVESIEGGKHKKYYLQRGVFPWHPVPRCRRPPLRKYGHRQTSEESKKHLLYRGKIKVPPDQHIHLELYKLYKRIK